MMNRQLALVSLSAAICASRVATQTVEYARAARAAATLTAAANGLLSQRAEIVVYGVPLPDAMRVTRESTNNVVYQKGLDEAREAMMRGEGRVLGRVLELG